MEEEEEQEQEQVAMGQVRRQWRFQPWPVDGRRLESITPSQRPRFGFILPLVVVVNGD